MKRIIMLFLVFGSVLNLSAQNKINLDTLDIEQLNLYKGKAVKMKNAGITLTLVGITVFGIFEDLALHALPRYILGDPDSDIDWNKRGSTYTIIGLGGLTSTIVGIPIWITGGYRKSKAEIALKKFDIKTDNSMAIGLGITLRF